MQPRIEVNRVVRDLFWKLERKREFSRQFESGQQFLEWTLQEALDAYERRPNQRLRRFESQ